MPPWSKNRYPSENRHNSPQCLRALLLNAVSSPRTQTHFFYTDPQSPVQENRYSQSCTRYPSSGSLAWVKQTSAEVMFLLWLQEQSRHFQSSNKQGLRRIILFLQRQPFPQYHQRHENTRVKHDRQHHQWPQLPLPWQWPMCSSDAPETMTQRPKLVLKLQTKREDPASYWAPAVYKRRLSVHSQCIYLGST